MEVTLYSTNCPKCIMLEKKMNMKGISYSINSDVDLMEEKGFTEIPILEVDGKILKFKEAVDWVNSLGGYN